MAQLTNQQENQIRAFVVKLAEHSDTTLSETTSLVESSLLDSLKIARLVIFLEGDLGIRIPDQDLAKETFENLKVLFAVINNCINNIN